MRYINTSLDEIRKLFFERLNLPIMSVKSLGGWNNRVLKIETKERDFVLKMYYSGEDDRRDRIGAEVSCLNFLWNRGIRCIPEPIFSDFEKKMAIYGFIEGENFSSEDIEEADIAQVGDFLKRLSEVSQGEDYSKFPKASEACFSFSAYIDILKRRRDKLSRIERLSKFLEMFDNLLKWTIGQSGSKIEEVKIKDRIISPSDVGFHNIIRNGEGKIYFVDFEYAGWDDPAKFILDFIHQPDVPIPKRLVKPFLESTLSALKRDIQRRLSALYPIIGLKWALIMLNEFLPETISRRKFADFKVKKEDLDIQLKRAEEKCKGLIEDTEGFSILVK